MPRTPFRLGYVDNDLNNFHAKIYLSLLRGELATRGFTIAGCFGLLTEPCRAWAAANDVPYFADAQELDAHVDGYLVLAPGHPELHLELFERVAGFGKPVFVDKPSAQDAATLERLFALADERGVAVQSSSALRCTAIQQRVREVGADQLQHVVAWGGGRSFEEYGIHPTELAVSCLGGQAQRVACRRNGDFTQLLVDFADGRTAVINVACNRPTPFAATLVFAKSTEHLVVDNNVLFRDAAGAILDFFAAGQAQIDRRETLAIRRILDAAEPALARGGWINL